MRFEDGDQFNPFTDSIPEGIPIRRLRELQDRAKNLLKELTAEEIESTRDSVHWMLTEYRAAEDEAWAEDSRCGEDHEQERLSDLDALEVILEQMEQDEEAALDTEEWKDHPRTPAASVCLATLALEQIGRAVTFYFDDDWPTALKDDAHEIQLQSIANDAADIMETVCWGEARERMAQLQSRHWAESFSDDIVSSIKVDIALKKERAEMERSAKEYVQQVEQFVEQQVEHLVRDRLSQAARAAADKTHETNRRNKAKAIADWKAGGHNFSTMRAFARNRYKEYGVTDFMTVYNWLRATSKAKA